MATHIQIHRSAIGGATPDVGNMLEGEVAVNLTDKKLYIKGATGELITLVDAHTSHDAAGSVGGIQFKDSSGFSGDTNKLFFDSANVRVGIGIATPREELDVVGTIQGSGISADGATFGSKGVTIEGDLYLQRNMIISEDGLFKIGSDTEFIQFDGSGAQIDLRSNEVSIERFLQHVGDGDTHLEFQTDQITLQAGGKDSLDIKGADGLVHAPYGISGGGATFDSDVILTNTGDIALTIKADTDNSGENDNPLIRMSQDGGGVNFDAGLIGDTGQIVTGSIANHAFLNTTYNGSGVQIATDDIVRMTISDGDAAGRVGIGTNAPRESLEVHGNIMTNNGVSGATFNVGSYVEFPNGTTLDGTQQDSIGISLRTGNQNFLTTGNKGIRLIPYKCSVDSWSVYAPSQGSIQFDINSGGHAQWPNLTSVAGSSLPSLSNQTSARDGTVNWTKTTFAAGDILEFHVDSVSGLTACTLCLNIIRRG